jgi:hypothetical protein
MSKLFTCDNCGQTFPQAIEEEYYVDEHGENMVMDLCAPCKNSFHQEKDKAVKDFVKKLKK